MASSAVLYGPPSLHANTNASVNMVQSAVDTLSINPQTQTTPKPYQGAGDSDAPGSGNPCLDFFFHVLPDTTPDRLIDLLSKAWAFCRLTTLKLVCNLRAIRGTGRSNTECFYVAALWLHKNHPRTLACNARVFAEFGYFKDLLEILYRLVEGDKIREVEKREREGRKWLELAKKRGRYALGSKKPSKKERAAIRRLKMEEIKKAKIIKKERGYEKAKKAYERYNLDPVYRSLHDSVSEAFAESLKRDVSFFNTGEIDKIGLAAKWCPSLDSAYDRAMLVCESIARRMFPMESDSEYDGLGEAHYSYRARNRLRKDVLVPLLKALEIPETYMTSNQWGVLPYDRVPSVAMKNYKSQFLKHDKQRFREYLADVQKSSATMAAGALLPHEIVKCLEGPDGGAVAERQWSRMVGDMRKEGKLRNCIAICDVSDAIYGTPMDVCLALGLLVSELSDDPWKGKVITFSDSPELQLVKGETLLDKISSIKRDRYLRKANLQKVFDRIIEVAAAGNLKDEQMIETLFVFSAMEGIYYDRKRYDYEETKKKFAARGFKMVPNIVFWNLTDTEEAAPAMCDQEGVATVSGFSKNMVKLFLDNGRIPSPVDVMKEAVSGDMYGKLAVFD